MTSGPEHYREAERLAAVYKDAIEAVEALPQDTERQRLARLYGQHNAHALLSKAQVHATLAAAAASALPYASDDALDPDGNVWAAQSSAWAEALR